MPMYSLKLSAWFLSVSDIDNKGGA